MIGMAEKPPKSAKGTSGAKKRNVIQITLDQDADAKLQKFIDRQRIKPERAAVVLTALLEFLAREEKA